DVPQVLGYHGNELRYYDELLGGQGEWKNLGYLSLWDLLAVRYVIAPAEGRGVDSIPGFRRVLDTVPILNGDAGTARPFEPLDPVPAQPSYLLIAENWYPDWQATADGQPAQVLRGDYSLITLALPAGAKVVELTFRSKLYELGRTLTIASLAGLLIALLAAVVLPRRARHG